MEVYPGKHEKFCSRRGSLLYLWLKNKQRKISFGFDEKTAFVVQPRSFARLAVPVRFQSSEPIPISDASIRRIVAEAGGDPRSEIHVNLSYPAVILPAGTPDDVNALSGPVSIEAAYVSGLPDNPKVFFIATMTRTAALSEDTVAAFELENAGDDFPPVTVLRALSPIPDPEPEPEPEPTVSPGPDLDEPEPEDFASSPAVLEPETKEKPKTSDPAEDSDSGSEHDSPQASSLDRLRRFFTE